LLSESDFNSCDYINNWKRRCEIITDYLPPFAKDGDHKKCVVRFGSYFLRHSKGPLQHHFWDVYGDNYIRPELALLALSQAQPPPRIFVVGVEKALTDE
jgi:hypothetical protein